MDPVVINSDHAYFSDNLKGFNFLALNVCGLFSKLKFGVLEKQIDLYELDKRETIAKSCLKGKKGKGGNKQVKKAEKEEWYDDNDWQEEWCECDGGDDDEYHEVGADDL